MRLIQRLINLWWTVWAAASGIEVNRLVPLPPPVVAPTVPAGELIAEADSRGVGDARSAMLSPYSFGGPGDEPSDVFDPDYIRALRHRREAATASLHAAQRLTDDRVALARRKRDESGARMDDARARMAGLAAREDLAAARAFADTGPGPEPGGDVLDEPAAAAGDTPWEGETLPLRLAWRLLILTGLVAAELPVQFYVFGYFLNQSPGASGAVRWLALSSSAIIVFGAFLAGTLLRTGAATGADRRTGYVIIVFAVAWLAAGAVLAIIRGRVLDRDRPRSDAVHVTPLTVILMFAALLLVVGAMSLMLGLARRHPFQEAYVRNRSRRDRFEMLMRTMATQLNPAYLDPENDGAPNPVDAQERAIREAYAAAEDAYFAALSRTLGDPVFTESVLRRRGLRAAS